MRNYSKQTKPACCDCPAYYFLYAHTVTRVSLLQTELHEISLLSEYSCNTGCRIRVQTHYSVANWGIFTMSNATFERPYLKMQSVPFSFFKDQVAKIKRLLKQYCSWNLRCITAVLYYWQASLHINKYCEWKKFKCFISKFFRLQING